MEGGHGGVDAEVAQEAADEAAGEAQLRERLLSGVLEAADQLLPGHPAGEMALRVDHHLAVARALGSPEVERQIAVTGMEVSLTTPEEMGEFLRRELDKWGRIARDSGARVN